MKRIILFLVLLVSISSFAQISKVQGTGYKQLTTAERDALVVPATEYWVIYNVTDGEFQEWDGAAGLLMEE